IDALDRTADDVGKEAGQTRTGADVEHGRDVAVVQHQGALAHFAHARQAQQNPTIDLLAGYPEAQVRSGDLDRLTRALLRKGVGNLLVVDHVADFLRTRLASPAVLDRSALAGRNREMDKRVTGVE